MADDLTTVLTDPAELGIDAGRLARTDALLQRYVDDGRLVGTHLVVRRRGHTVHSSLIGQADREAGREVRPDTLWRIYSMTKPITSVAAMILAEQGAFELTDPVSRWIPSLADLRVWQDGTAAKPRTVPVSEPVRVWHLLTHTAGFTYGFHHVHPVDEMYRAAGFELMRPAGMDLETTVDTWASLPLLFQPGAEWAYGHNTDVLGRLVEVVSGQRLDDFLAEHVFGPLGMTDTGWAFPADQVDRAAALYVPMPGTGEAVRFDLLGDEAFTEPAAHHGGGGLVSTASDYARFTQMLADKGAYTRADGSTGRLLGPRTVDWMTRNHLPGGADLEAFGRKLYAEVDFAGVGFGLGFAVVQDPAAYKILTSPGEYSWGGAASTAFWIDPVEQLQVILMTQLVPSSTWPMRTQLRGLVQQSLVD